MLRVARPVADRGVGEASVVEALPDAVVALSHLLTHLGDPVTLLLLVTAGYLLADHLDVPSTRMATALALALGALALTLALKHGFALPRPPDAGTDGFGFPSGHAIGATVVYGGLARLVAPDDRRATGVAAALVVLVAASRVLIGVHYLVDVIVGVAVGVGYLAVAFRLGPGWGAEDVSTAAAARTFALAVGLGLVAVGVTVVVDTVVAVAAAAGGWIGWRVVAERVTETAGTTRQLVASVVVLPAVGFVATLVAEGDVSLAVAAVLAGSVVALVVVAPGLWVRGARTRPP
ncbi:phosphatase PAP2 family protein [Haloplanus rubicundus]|uniref:Phosphatase PAP2 family protein n=1 Tax=Haloplanus rubicundus TaxID=1547898 RepID=A0A345E8Z2_9EURY|nr:phosphatase PAP2 family protein [Haloplanus rubicundus]AXG08664.1 phosphatase PAP2 family protein [Haloplanus rubicundus]